MRKNIFWLAIPLFLCAIIAACVTFRTNVVNTIQLVPQDAVPDQKIANPMDINTATLDEWMLLPGIGKNLAERIIDYRLENGPFTTVEDLLKVKGIGMNTYSTIAHYLTVGGQS